LAILGLSSFGKKPKETANTPQEDTGGIKPPSNIAPPNIAPPTKPRAKGDLILKNGSRGIEVVELQKLLGITADGIFGPVTERTLFAKKGVLQISLNQYATTTNQNSTMLKAGDRVKAINIRGVDLFKAFSRPNNVFYTNFVKEGFASYNEPIGIIKSVGESQTAYSVRTFASMEQKVVFVKIADVIKY